MALLRLSCVAAVSLAALILLAWLASARPPAGVAACHGGPGYEVCHAGLAAADRRPRRGAL